MNYLMELPASIGVVTESSEQNTHESGTKYTKLAASIQEAISGNRCGHIKSLPRFMPQHSRQITFPKIIQKAHESLEISYFDFKTKWRSLNFLDNQLKRSERREACILVGQFLNLNVQLKDFSIKSPVKDIARYTKLSLSRIKRAIKDLIKAGYVKTSHFIKHCFKGAWFGITAIRKLTSKFYLELGSSEYAIESAIKHKRGEKMVDTRAKNKQFSFINKALNVFSTVNNKDFFVSKGGKEEKTTCDLARENFIPEDVAAKLVIKAKEIAKSKGVGWFAVYRELEQEWKSYNF